MFKDLAAGIYPPVLLFYKPLCLSESNIRTLWIVYSFMPLLVSDLYESYAYPIMNKIEMGKAS